MASFLVLVSGLFGWVYTFCWSASFYPQPLLNLGRRSTSGTTVDFPFLNVLGFAAYLASNVALYYSPVVREQYAARNRGLAPTVRLNDVAFALHALALSLATALQYLARRAWGFAAASGTRPSRFSVAVAAGCALGLAVTCVAVANSARDWCELDLVYAAGYVKLVVTLVKYTPQIVVNWRNRSTDGWSIWQVLLDVAGGGLSLAQQAIDSYLQRDWSGISGNPVKFALGNASLFYDSIFIVQHYVVYRAASSGKPAWRSEEEPLLDDDDDDDDDVHATPAGQGDDRRRRRLD